MVDGIGISVQGAAATFEPMFRNAYRLKTRVVAGLTTLLPLLIGEARSAATSRLNGRDIDLLHLHHRIEGAFGGSGIGVG